MLLQHMRQLWLSFYIQVYSMMNSYCQFYFTLTSGCMSGGRLRSRRWPQIIYNFPNPIPIPFSLELSFISLFFFFLSLLAPHLSCGLLRLELQQVTSYVTLYCLLHFYHISSIFFQNQPNSEVYVSNLYYRKILLLLFTWVLPLVQWIIYSIVESSASSIDFI